MNTQAQLYNKGRTYILVDTLLFQALWHTACFAKVPKIWITKHAKTSACTRTKEKGKFNIKLRCYVEIENGEINPRDIWESILGRWQFLRQHFYVFTPFAYFVKDNVHFVGFINTSSFISECLILGCVRYLKKYYICI